MAEIFEMSDGAHQFRTYRPELFPPEIPVIPSTTGKFREDRPEYSNKGTAQGKPCG
jgi:hypothetical protein